ncbi:hypothetical protein BD410DRAFT_806377 [Rickenella mellea]|uniref:Protein kinase domain-containing protein n=1 Tax=Rickenella mellea TaxID=50990 RepID=A0A4Y7PTB8_9AGAM|nr:hypothetical protein BD410DRAFT_806377 [Rickenella mellea]
MDPSLDFTISRRIIFNTEVFPTTPATIKYDPENPESPLPRNYETSEIDVPTLIDARPLEIGQDKWAQIYACQMEDPRLEGQADVVLKLYQEQYFPPRYDEEDYSIPNYESELQSRNGATGEMTEELLAWTETWAYARLQSLQGTCIPIFYGTYEFILPDGEVSLGIILSFVRGVDLQAYCHLVSREEKMNNWHNVARDICVAIDKIHKLGVMHGDTRSDNIMISTPSTDDPTTSEPCHPVVTIIDFALSRSLPYRPPHHSPSANEDIFAVSEMILEVCCRTGRVDTHTRIVRRCEFYEEVKRRFPEDAWLQSPEWRDCIDCGGVVPVA